MLTYKMDHQISILLKLITVLILQPEPSISAEYSKEPLGSLLEDCNYICRVIQFDISREVKCGFKCKFDAECLFFQFTTAESKCIVCTKNVTNYKNYVEIDRTTFSSGNTNVDVFKNSYRIANAGACVPDCTVYQKFNSLTSGVYTLHLSASSFDVYCDMETDGGGWTVFQRRMDGSEIFYRTWSDYENGFGDLNGEFWLGNSHISDITSQGSYELRFDLGDFEWTNKYAVYFNFSIDGNDYYRTSHFSYQGNAGNAFSTNGYKFTTYDSDNDGWSNNCAVRYKGAWWYNACHASNINGLYLNGANDQEAEGVVWYHWRGHRYSLRFTEMKIRPTDYVPPHVLYASDGPAARDCSEHRDRGATVSGVYSITTTGRDPHTFDVYCDMDTDNGGWVVFQKRYDGSEDFYKSWTEYQNGFGSLTREFWLGNDKISYITDQGAYEVRFDIEDYDNDRRYAFYDSFSINRDDEYRLQLGIYSGDAGDSMTDIHNGNQFATYDNDNEQNIGCAVTYHGAWWYSGCHRVNLNGIYGSTEYGKGINWDSFRGVYYSMKTTSIKIRPAGYSS